jgi:DNA integrity scanning protein DisA with diadenylate cyclase activity
MTAARELARELAGEAVTPYVLVLTETDLDWEAVRRYLDGCRLLVAAETRDLKEKLRETLASFPDCTVLDTDPGPTPIQERMSLALLEAVRTDKLPHNADVVVIYNGIDVGQENPESIDTLSVLHLGEHLERLTARDLRKLDTHVPLETLRAVVDLAVEIGREGREGHPVGTMFVVGDTRKVLELSCPMNFNPFRGYSQGERDIRKRSVREQIKDIAQLEGAIIIRRDGVALAACMRIHAPDTAYTLSKGLGTRHAAAAAISKSTRALAITVSQSSGTVRLFQNGEIVLRIEPMARPLTWGRFRMETQDASRMNGPLGRRAPSATE